MVRMHQRAKFQAIPPRLRCDMTFIVPMHRNKPDITYLRSPENSPETYLEGQTDNPKT